ncbi:ABC transporter permease [Gorillibacterium sp. sgz5001074]|uniref:ABC transporter permease n=1 Tax=Gorillibacterium sp. sgz5001074 TaxID=3446695 RepID=UPI003F6684A1
MLTPGGTAAKRIRASIRFQYRSWRMAVDWTVALYIVIPALILAGYQYGLLYKEPPLWLAHVPYAVMRSLWFVFAAGGTLRYYVEEADQLFLVQRTEWFRSMMGWGMIFSMAKHALWTLGAAALFYPLLTRVYGVGPGQTAYLFTAIYLFKLHLMLGKQWLSIRFSGWRSVLIQTGLLPVAGLLFALLTAIPRWGWPAELAAAVLLALPLLRLLPARIRMRGAFFHDIRREQQERMKVAGILLSIGGFPAPKKTKLRRKKPLLFASSRKLFRERSAENVLAESLIKAFFRTKAKLKVMGYFALASSMAILVSPPGGGRFVVWLVVSTVYVWMSAEFAKDGAQESYVRLFHWEDTVRFAAFQKAGLWISLPLVLLLAVLTALLQRSGVNGVLLIPLGAGVSWMGSQMFGLWGGGPRKG